MKITVFYIIYYSFLTGFFMLMLLAFFATLYDDKPTWVGDSKGIIGTNPGWLNILYSVMNYYVICVSKIFIFKNLH